MATKNLTDPVSETGFPRMENAVDVGEDLDFQEKWWRFERILWSFFALVLVADALGVFGAGPLAKATLKVPGSGILVHYERVERASTPSQLSIQFDKDAVQNGRFALYVNEPTVKKLGASRVVPQAAAAAVQEGGVVFQFPTDGTPNEVNFQLQPNGPGVCWMYLQVPGHTPVKARVIVMP